MKLKLTELAHLAEIVAAIAVVVSLIYVGREVQGNTAAIRASALQSVSQRSSEALQTLAYDSVMSRIREVGNADPSLLSAREAYRFREWNRGYWLTMQNVYFQHQLGVFEADVWQGYNRIVCAGIAQAGLRATWEDHRNALSTTFVEVVESCPDF